ncbi:MAG: hypothetical protein WC494_04050 [Candidatus Pacearchaeota archaeon]
MKKRFNKKAQFFLLAAVIISAIVISLGIIANQAKITKEPSDFYDYGFTVKTETGALIDFEIFTASETTNLDEFVGLMAKDIKDKDPELNFIFIYGNNEELVIENYGDEEIVADVKSIPEDEAKTILGANTKIKSKIRMGGSSTEYEYDLLYGGSDSWRKVYEGLDVGDEITITIWDYNYNFRVSRHKQIIFIVEKQGESDERYISFQ